MNMSGHLVRHLTRTLVLTKNLANIVYKPNTSNYGYSAHHHQYPDQPHNTYSQSIIQNSMKELSQS